MIPHPAPESPAVLPTASAGASPSPSPAARPAATGQPERLRAGSVPVPPAAVPLADPCASRPLPPGGGATGSAVLQPAAPARPMAAAPATCRAAGAGAAAGRLRAVPLRSCRAAWRGWSVLLRWPRGWPVLRGGVAGLLGLLLLLVAAPVRAHKESDGYLSLMLSAGLTRGTLDLHVTDLDAALGLDADADGQIRKAEVRAALPRIEAYVAERLSLHADGDPCTLGFGEAGFTRRPDGPYLTLPLEAACSGALRVGWRLFFDTDSRHRGRLVASDGTRDWVAVFAPGQTEAEIGTEPQGAAAVLAVFIPQGVLHIWEGTDHILFLLTLILAASRGETLGQSLRRVGGIVTAFTLAHSVTLSLASFGVLRIDPGLIESLIAVTVVLGALNVLWPLVQRDLWGIALGFGLIHGFGFANVLAELAMPQGFFALALLAFNLGVELGQIAIVAVVLPVLFLARRQWVVRALAIPGAAAAIALIGGAWVSDRAFGTTLLWF